MGYNACALVAEGTGIEVTNTPGVLTDATAEIAMMFDSDECATGGEGERHLRAGEWSGWRPTHMLSSQGNWENLRYSGHGRIGTNWRDRLVMVLVCTCCIAIARK